MDTIVSVRYNKQHNRWYLFGLEEYPEQQGVYVMPTSRFIKEISARVDRTVLDEVLKKNNLLDFDEALKQQIEEQIQAALSMEALTVDMAREIIDKWLKRMIFGRKDISFTDSNLSLQIENNIALFIEFKYQIENRATRERVVRVARLDKRSIGDKLEGLWDSPINEIVATNKKGAFIVGQYKWTRKGSSELCRCAKCSGSGQVWGMCRQCWGSGEITKQDRVVMVGSTFKNMGQNAGGSVGYVERKEVCPRCQGSKQVLTICDSCGGSGQLYQYQEIESRLSVEHQSLIISPYEKIRLNWLRGADVRYLVNYEDIVSGQGEEKLRQSMGGKYTLEYYNAKIIPISKIIYQFGKETGDIYIVNGKPKTTSIIRFLNKKKILFTILLMLCGIAILAIVSLLLMRFGILKI